MNTIVYPPLAGRISRQGDATMKKRTRLSALALSLGLILTPLLPTNHAAAQSPAVNPSGTTTATMDATDGSFSVPAGSTTGLNNPNLRNEGTIEFGADYSAAAPLSGNPSAIVDITAGMFGYDNGGTTTYDFTNAVNAIINVNSNAGGGSALGMYAFSGSGRHTLLNEGSITATAMGFSDDSYGMSAYGGSSTLTNKSSIEASVTGDGSFAHAMFGLGDSNVFNNEGTLTVTAINNIAYGIYSDGDSNFLNNQDAITVTGNDVTGLYARGELNTLANIGTIDASGTKVAYGIQVQGTSNTTTNEGTITAEATSAGGNATGIYINGESNTTTNIGNITTTVAHGLITFIPSFQIIYADAIGIRTEGNFNTSTNEGTISITDLGTGAYSNTFGMHTIGTSNSITNNNSITVTGNNSRGNAYGLYAEGERNTLTNNSTISALVTSNSSAAYGMNAVNDYNILINNGTITSISEHNQSNASGIVALLGDLNTITNNKVITVTSLKGATGISGGTDSKIINNGAITVTALGSAGTANGIVTNGGTDSSFTNIGFIHTSNIDKSNGEAYEIYGNHADYNVNTVAVTLRDWTALDAIFGAKQNVNPNFDNSTLVLRPGDFGQGFAYGQLFEVANSVSIDQDPDPWTDDMQLQGSHGTNAGITGTIGAAVTEVPYLTANLYGANTNAPQVSLTINEEQLPGGATQQKAISQARGQFTNIGNALARQTYGEKGETHFFFTPYYTLSDNSTYDFNGRGFGATGGLTYAATDSLRVGFHLDFNDTSYDGGALNAKTDSTSFAFGLHANYDVTPSFYLRSQLSTFFGQNDANYNFQTDYLSASSKASYDSQAVFAALSAGYTWQINEISSLTPELGLSYLNVTTDDYSLIWQGSNTAMYNGLYDLQYGEGNYNGFFADAKLNWESKWLLEDGDSIRLTANAGVRQRLNGDDIEVPNMVFTNSNFNFNVTEDKTAALAGLGLEYNKDNFSFSLDYNGAFGDEQVDNTFNLLYKHKF